MALAVSLLPKVLRPMESDIEIEMIDSTEEIPEWAHYYADAFKAAPIKTVTWDGVYPIGIIYFDELGNAHPHTT